MLNVHAAEGLASTPEVSIATPSLGRHESKENTKIHAGLNEYSRFLKKRSNRHLMTKINGRSVVIYAHMPCIDLESSMCLF